MIKLYASNIIKELSDEGLDLINENFDSTILDRINQATNTNYKLKRFTTRLMLINIFKELNIDTMKLKAIYYNDQGKLIIPDEKINISISYCEDKAICLVSNSKIGVDIENLNKKVSLKNRSLLETFTKTEIGSSLSFYKAWTKIESIIKIYKNVGIGKLFTNNNFFKSTYNTKYLLFENNFLIAISTKN